MERKREKICQRLLRRPKQCFRAKQKGLLPCCPIFNPNKSASRKKDARARYAQSYATKSPVLKISLSSKVSSMLWCKSSRPMACVSQSLDVSPPNFVGPSLSTKSRPRVASFTSSSRADRNRNESKGVGWRSQNMSPRASFFRCFERRRRLREKHTRRGWSSNYLWGKTSPFWGRNWKHFWTRKNNNTQKHNNESSIKAAFGRVVWFRG